jgi:amidophosphoribosyltransferase
MAKPSHITKQDPLGHVLRHLQGAYSLLFLFPDRIEAARDPFGIRPLSIGKTQSGKYCVASETCALDAIDAEYIRDVEPGEIVTLSNKGIQSRFFMEPGSVTPGHCIFEHVYFSKPTSKVFGENVHEVRKRSGEQLAKEYPVEADVVIPIPDSGTSSAIGYAKQSGIPFDMGFVRSHYIGRTFIAPTQDMRDIAVKLKLSVCKEVVNGKRVVVVDDSVVRGTTTRGKIRSLRQAGATEIHMRVACPPVAHPCFYGVDFPTKDELLANNHKNMKEIAKHLGADSIGYISLDGLLSCASLPPDHYCTACWSGNYKIPVSSVVNKFAMERHQMQLFDSTD